MIKGLIFDVDGVLLDSMGMWKNLGKRYLIAQGIEPEENLSEILFSMSMEEGASYLILTYHLEKSPKAVLEEIGKMMETFYFEEVPLKPGARDLLEYCKKNTIPMIAATSSMRQHVEKAFFRTGISGYIKEILTTSEIGESKHNPLIYKKAADILEAVPDDLLVLEDSLYALETAKKAGFHVIGVCDPLGEENQKKLAMESEVYVNELSEVIPYIESFI